MNISEENTLPLDQRLAWSIEDVELATGIKRDSIYKAMSQGALRSFKVGRRRLFRPASVKRWIEDLERDTG